MIAACSGRVSGGGREAAESGTGHAFGFCAELTMDLSWPRLMESSPCWDGTTFWSCWGVFE